MDEAFRAARLSCAKVRTMTRIATSADEAALLELAFPATGAQLERICRGYQQGRVVDRLRPRPTSWVVVRRRWLWIALLCSCGWGMHERGLGEPTAAMDKDVCFGGNPELVSTEPVDSGFTNSSSAPLVAVKGRVVWQQGYDILQLDTAKGAGTVAGVGADATLKAADSREAFAWSSHPPGDLTSQESKLVAFDLSTGKRRVVIDDEQNRPLPYDSHLVLDGDFLYFIHGNGSCEANDSDGLFRVGLYGSGRSERVGSEPSCTNNAFLIRDGHVYWKQFPRAEGPSEIRRRMLSLDATTERLAVAKDHPLPMAVGAGRLYYIDRQRLFSVPVDASSPALEHFRAEGATPLSTMLYDRGCLYWTTWPVLAIVRARLDARGSASPEVIADRTTYGGGPMATDGMHLFWLDQERKRMMRVRRSEKAIRAW